MLGIQHQEFLHGAPTLLKNLRKVFWQHSLCSWPALLLAAGGWAQEMEFEQTGSLPEGR